MTSLDNLLISRSEALSAGGTGLASFYEHEIRNELYHRSFASALDKIYNSGDRDASSEGEVRLMTPSSPDNGQVSAESFNTDQDTEIRAEHRSNPQANDWIL